jgi:hypothetical protein
MSAAPRYHTLVTTTDDVITIEMKHWHGDGETYRIFELSGEILCDALYFYLDDIDPRQIYTLPPWRVKPKKSTP